MANLFRGKDRDILKAVRDRGDMITHRDTLAALGFLRPSLSTMEALIDPLDADIIAAYGRVRAHCVAKLALTR